VLHIGTNKTGTSTLQVYLGTHRQELLKRGIWFPNIGSFEFAHHELAEAIKFESDFARFGINPYDLKGPSVPAGTSTVLISSENFHTVRDVSGVAKLFPRGSTKVVLYLREHVSYLSSWYQQDVQAARARITCSFPDFALLRGYPLMDLVGRWREYYGDNLIVRAYDRAKLVKGDIVEDFFDTAFGMGPPAPRTFEDKNPSISGNLLFLKLWLNHVLTLEENRRIVEELSALALLDERFRGPLPVAEPEAKRIAHRYGPDRKQLKQQYGTVFHPPRTGLAGSPTPDFNRLRDDVALIVDAAKLRRFAFHEIFMAKRDLLFPS